MQPLRLASFSTGNTGGNPAGVLIAKAHPPEAEMRKIAARLGYSETVFACPTAAGGSSSGSDPAWRVRYFSPETEVSFCGHATIALGAALAAKHGDGIFPLRLNHADITVEGRRADGGMWAALQSPPTHSGPADPALLKNALLLFGLTPGDLDPRIPATFAGAGATHLILPLTQRDTLAAMRYDLAAGKALMNTHDLVTVALVWAQDPQTFHARNAFASAGVLEDPATGAAAAALAGALRDLDWPHCGQITVVQGEDMGSRSIIAAEIPTAKGGSIRISGSVRTL